jgi:hypothetical protein
VAACYTSAQGRRGTFGKTLGARRLFKISIETSKSANFVTVAADDVFGRGGILNILKTTNPSGLIQGTKMAAISLGQGSHPTITSNTEAGQFSNSDSRFGVDQLRISRQGHLAPARIFWSFRQFSPGQRRALSAMTFDGG